jgi:hypothetical protein
MSEPTLDTTVAAKLGMHPEQVGQFRNEWERNPMATVIKAAFSVKLETMAKERERKLRSCEPEELKKLQGELNGLQLAMDLINSPLR